MEQRIVFGVMSATQSPAIVDQLAGLLQPHTVVVHHDFRKRADYRPTASNVELIPDPRDTGWGTWGFSDAIFHTLRYALDRHDFDYFQLLSPTCLPLRPVEEFEAFVGSDQADAHADLIEIDRDDDTLMTFGYRTFLPGGTVRFRLLRRTRSWYFGSDSDLIQTKSLSVLKRRSADGQHRFSLGATSGLLLTRFAAAGGLGRHPFGPDFKPTIGGTFFGARAKVCEHLVRMSEDEQTLAFFRGLQIVDETLFATLLGNSGFVLGPANHAINDFSSEGSPRWVEDGDLERLRSTKRYFARKFVDDPCDPVRLRVLDMLVRPPALAVAPPAVPIETAVPVHTARAVTSGAFAAVRAPGAVVPSRIVFGLMSAQQPDETVGQLVEALHPYPVVVHHDYTKRREFNLAMPNVAFVSDPKITGWGTWGFVEAIFRTIEHALEHHDFDYFQLLSPTCLPLRPLAEFQSFVDSNVSDINADVLPLDTDDDIMMTFGYRAFSSASQIRFRFLRRMRSWYFGSDSDLVQHRSLSILKRRDAGREKPDSIKGRTSLALTRMLAQGRIGSLPFGPDLRPMVGSTWFGARREVCEHLVRASRDDREVGFFRGLNLVDEIVFPTLLANSRFRMGPSNHVISKFDERGNPIWIEPSDLDGLLATGRFFARKFPEDISAPVRLRTLGFAAPSVSLVS
jgi:hypothetical protein